MPQPQQHLSSGSSSGSPLREAKVTKEYLEDLGERDTEGFSDSACRYWLYVFDFGDREYEARVYRDAPGVAFVRGPTPWLQAPTDPYLRAIAGHLEADAGAVDVHLIGARGGYKRVVFVD